MRFSWNKEKDDKERLPLLPTDNLSASSSLYTKRGIPSTLAQSLSLIPFVQQESHFDCGLACASMVIQSITGNISDSPAKLARQNKVRNSVWTIDICYLLKEHVKDMTYFTSYIGVNFQNACKYPIYTSTLEKDKKRIHARFSKASAAGIRIIPDSLGKFCLLLFLAMDDLIRFLWCNEDPTPSSSPSKSTTPRIINPYVCIILLNAAHLNCIWCHSGRKRVLPCWCTPTSSVLQAMSTDEFIGHYVLLVGYDLKKVRRR
jgi:hypothetical protein